MRRRLIVERLRDEFVSLAPLVIAAHDPRSASHDGARKANFLRERLDIALDEEVGQAERCSIRVLPISLLEPRKRRNGSQCYIVTQIHLAAKRDLNLPIVLAKGIGPAPVGGAIVLRSERIDDQPGIEEAGGLLKRRYELGRLAIRIVPHRVDQKVQPDRAGGTPCQLEAALGKASLAKAIVAGIAFLPIAPPFVTQRQPR